MPLVLGIGVSHSPTLYRPRERWPDVYKALIRDVPQPNRAGEETPEQLDAFNTRIQAAFDALRSRLADARPDAVVVLSADKGRVFSVTQTPQISVYVGDEIWGTTHYPYIGEEPADGETATLACHAAVSAWLVDELVEEGFDANVNRFFKPLGAPEDGAGQELTDPVRRIVAHDVPIVPVWINAHRKPTISGRRMPSFGRALAKVLDEREERIAVIASGGLSGDPQGYLAGWVDERLDDWITSRLRRGKSEQLGSMWDLDSDTVRGATGEVRLWIALGSAMESLGAKAKFVDYIRFHHATVGTAFAYWEPPQG